MSVRDMTWTSSHIFNAIAFTLDCEARQRHLFRLAEQLAGFRPNLNDARPECGHKFVYGKLSVVISTERNTFAISSRPGNRDRCPTGTWRPRTLCADPGSPSPPQ